MRKLILIAAFALASATAQAGVSRGLTLASSDDTTAAANGQPATVDKTVEAPKTSDMQKPAETPTYVARPAAVETPAQTPQPDQVQAAPERRILKAEKPKRRHESTEARVIYELHRHGIYW